MTDQALLDLVQYAVLETVDHGVSFPSGLWTPAEVLAYANEQQQAILRESKLYAGVALIDPVVAGNPRQTVADDWIGTVGLLWQASPPDGAWTPVFQASARELDALLANWTSAGTPLFWADGETTSLTIRVAPSPTAGGRFEHLYLAKGATLDLVGSDGTGEILTLTDDLAGVLYYRILMRMLSKVGRAQDPARAGFARDMAAQQLAAAQALLEEV